MNVFLFCGDKGGVGKSTQSNVWAQYLCKYVELNLQKKPKGAFIDLDPQSNSSKYNLPNFMTRDNAHEKGFKPIPLEDFQYASSIADIFHGTEEIYPYPSELVSNLDVFPAYASQLEKAKMQTRTDIQKNIIQRFRDFINILKQYQEYDFVVIDTSPSKGPLMLAPLAAATHVFFPIIMEPWGIDGFWGMHQLYKQEAYTRSSDRPLKLAGILPNLVRKVSLHQSYLKELQELPATGSFILPPVGQRVAFGEIAATGAKPKSIFDLKDSELAKQESLRWCAEAYRRIFKDA
jgi:chromosome partitioning protein